MMPKLTIVADSAAPGRRPDGEPWVRWGRSGDYSGWYAIGTRVPEQRQGLPFWQSVVVAVAALSGRRLDAAHALGPAILEMGALGVTLADGDAQLLLHRCLLAAPAWYTEVMAELFHLSGFYTKERGRSPDGGTFRVGPIAVLCDHTGHALLSEDELRRLVMLGSGSLRWTKAEKDRSRVWVAAVSKLLRHEAMDAVQAGVASELLPRLVPPRVLTSISWSGDPGAEWQYTPERQLLWAYAMVRAALGDREMRELESEREEATVQIPKVAARVKRETEKEDALGVLAGLFKCDLGGG